MYEGLNDTGGLWPSVYTGLNALAENIVSHGGTGWNQSFQHSFRCSDSYSTEDCKKTTQISALVVTCNCYEMNLI